MTRSGSERRWAMASAPTPLAWSSPDAGAGPLERLVILLPILLLPHIGTLGDILRIACLLVAVLAIDLGLSAGLDHARSARGFTPAALGLAIGVGLGLAIGPGPTWPLTLFAAVVMLERTALANHEWLAPIGLRGLAAALLVDLTIVALGLERSIDWLALGGGLGIALAAADALLSAEAAANDPAPGDRRIGLLETTLAIGLVVAIGAHAALLAGEPTLEPLARAGGYLILPLFALALLRFGWLAFERRTWPDALGGALLIAWALAASLLLEP